MVGHTAVVPEGAHLAGADGVQRRAHYALAKSQDRFRNEDGRVAPGSPRERWRNTFRSAMKSAGRMSMRPPLSKVVSSLLSLSSRCPLDNVYPRRPSRRRPSAFSAATEVVA